LYSFPINLFTLYQLYGVSSPEEAKWILESKRVKIDNPANLEEWVLSQVGEEIYETFIKGYTTKQWGVSPKELPTFIIKRLPIRLNFNDNYFFDQYQGIPIGGYTELFKNLLEGIQVELNVDFFNFKCNYKKLIYTGPIDKYYGYKFGPLEYRSLRFEEQKLSIPDFQGNAIVNYTEESIPHTRIIEHKHFTNLESESTIITKEFPSKEGEPFYPINNEKNSDIYKKYKSLSDCDTNVLFGGRLAEYRYYDMHQVVGSALHLCSKISK
jgi:UDP-galactopyranose mutase